MIVNIWLAASNLVKIIVNKEYEHYISTQKEKKSARAWIFDKKQNKVRKKGFGSAARESRGKTYGID